MTVEDLLSALSNMGIHAEEYHRCEIYIDEAGGVDVKRSSGRMGITLCNDHVDSLRGIIAWIPEQPGDKFLTILLGVTQCHTLSRDVTPKNNKTTESRNVRKTVH